MTDIITACLIWHCHTSDHVCLDLQCCCYLIGKWITNNDYNTLLTITKNKNHKLNFQIYMLWKLHGSQLKRYVPPVFKWCAKQQNLNERLTWASITSLAKKIKRTISYPTKGSGELSKMAQWVEELQNPAIFMPKSK